MTTLITILVFLAVLSVLVFVHELGHFLVSRRFGAKAEEFGLGFPPRLAGFYKNISGKWKTIVGSRDVSDAADTIYSLNWIPLGGFVKIKGEDGAGKNESDSFAAKPIWQRALILSAGVIMNVILAFILLTVTLSIGATTSINGAQLPADAIVSNARVIITGVEKDTPAASAGLKSGDEILAISGRSLKTVKEIRDFVGDKQGQSLNYEIKRGKDDFTKAISPVRLAGADRAAIGVSLDVLAAVRLPWYRAIPEGAKMTVDYTWLTAKGIFSLIVGIFQGHGISKDIAGPVGIAAMTGEYLDIGFVYLLQFAALLSISLAVINFVPFPALDGGRILFLIIEKIKGRPVKATTEAIIHNIGFLLLIVLILMVTFRDVKRLIM